jgi:hypothetical protein
MFGLLGVCPVVGAVMWILAARSMAC